MKIKVKIILAFLLLSLPILALGIISIFDLNLINNQIDSGLKENIKNIETNINLNSHAQFIRYYDEVLTQSARNYAFTADIKWKDRYLQFAPELNQQIVEAIALGDEVDKKIFASIDASNLALVDMEERAITLVDKDKNQEAINILEGAEYAKQKEIYRQGLVQYVEKQGKKYNETLAISTDSLNAGILSIQHGLETGVFWTAISVIITIIFGVILGILIAANISNPIKHLSKITRDIAKGNLDQKININTKDEINDLAESFTEMVKNVREAKENIEGKVKERTTELEKTNKFMVGRELKMIFLKKQLEQVKEELNKKK